MAGSTTHPSSEQRKDDTHVDVGTSTEAVVVALLDHIDAGDRSGFMGLIAPDAVQVEPAADAEFRGPENIAANIWSYRNTFPDLHFAATNLFACGTHAVAGPILRGTYEPYTYGDGARMISCYGCLVMDIEHEKISRIALYADRLNMLDQLGALPLAPETPSPRPHGFSYRRLEPLVHGSSSAPAHHDDVWSWSIQSRARRA